MVRIKYFIKRWAKKFRHNLVSNITFVICCSVIFLTLSTFWTTAHYFNQVFSKIESDLFITIYFKSDANETQMNHIKNTLQGLKEVKNIKIYEPADMKKQLVASNQINGINNLSEKLFPAAMEVYLNPNKTTEERLNILISNLKTVPIVESIQNYPELLSRTNSITNLFNIITVALGIIIVFTTILVVTITLKTQLHSYSEEIEIMKLCGATDRFIKAPFLVEKFIYGFLSSIISLILLSLILVSLEGKITDFLPEIERIKLHIPSLVIVGILIIGPIISVTGSYLTLNRFLKTCS